MCKHLKRLLDTSPHTVSVAGLKSECVPPLTLGHFGQPARMPHSNRDSPRDFSKIFRPPKCISDHSTGHIDPPSIYINHLTWWCTRANQKRSRATSQAPTPLHSHPHAHAAPTHTTTATYMPTQKSAVAPLNTQLGATNFDDDDLQGCDGQLLTSGTQRPHSIV